MKRILSGVLLMMLLASVLYSATNILPVAAQGTIYIRADGSIDPPTTSITTADNVTYTFTNNINDSIVVERDNTVVDGAGYTIQGTGATGSKGIDLTGRSNVTIENSEITMFERGISLHWSSNINISENNVTANTGYGIYLDSSSDSSISGNDLVANDWYGLWLRDSFNNNMTGNNVTANRDFGIVLSYSQNNILRNNNMANNGRNFGVYGDAPSYFLNDVDASNTVDGKPVCYWINRQGTEVPLDVGYLALVNCTHITVKDLSLTNNREGTLLVSTTNSTIAKNNVASNDFGIDLEWSFNNTIFGNNITANSVYGMSFIESSSNNIAGNNITANSGYAGAYLYESLRNTIIGNNITDNSYGIEIDHSFNNTISENNMANNWEGTYLSSSSNNTIAGNTFTNDGLAVFDSYGNLVEENFVNDEPLVYLEAKSDYAVESAGQVILLNCINMTIEELNLSNTTLGIQLWRTNNTRIENNNITDNLLDGIELDGSINNSVVGNDLTNNSGSGIHFSRFSEHNDISGNSIAGNNQYGVWVDYSSNNSIFGNNITNNGGGIWPEKAGIKLSYSSNNSIAGNNITNNHQGGVSLYDCSNNSLVGNNITNDTHGIELYWSSSNNSLYGNEIIDNDCGIWLYDSSNNWICHNNFKNNTYQVINYAFWSINVWDDGYPSGGNYWSDFNGTDANPDGIGDSNYTIDADNSDRYPLMGVFSEFDWVSLVAPEQRIQTICNSTLSNLVFNGTAISFDVTGDNGTNGFCRICVPKVFMNDTFHVFVNGTETSYDTVYSNSTHNYIYFTYAHSTQEVVIVPEFPFFIILPIFTIVTLLTVASYRKKISKSRNRISRLVIFAGPNDFGFERNTRF